MLEISIYGMDQLIGTIKSIEERGNNLLPLALSFGEVLTEKTKKQFETETDFNGIPWEKNSPVTLAHKKGSKPLVDNGTLAASIDYQPIGDYGVEIGANLDQVNMMHYGGTKSQFPNLWGDIPARPIFGLSDKDNEYILAATAAYLLGLPQPDYR